MNMYVHYYFHYYTFLKKAKLFPKAAGNCLKNCVFVGILFPAKDLLCYRAFTAHYSVCGIDSK